MSAKICDLFRKHSLLIIEDLINKECMFDLTDQEIIDLAQLAANGPLRLLLREAHRRELRTDMIIRPVNTQNESISVHFERIGVVTQIDIEATKVTKIQATIPEVDVQ